MTLWWIKQKTLQKVNDPVDMDLLAIFIVACTIERNMEISNFLSMY